MNIGKLIFEWNFESYTRINQGQAIQSPYIYIRFQSATVLVPVVHYSTGQVGTLVPEIQNFNYPTPGIASGKDDH